MSDFSTTSTLSIQVSSSSLTAARNTIESELGGTSIDVNPTSTTAVGDGGTTMTGGLAAGGLAGASDMLSQGVELATERNELLHEIRDFAERGAMSSGDSGGGGVLNTLLPIGILSSLGGGGLLSGALTLSASSVLAVSGTLGLAAAGVLAVTGTIDLNPASIITVTGTMAVGIASVLTITGALSLGAAAVLGVTGTLGLAAAAVLAVTGVMTMNASNVLSVTGTFSIAAAAALAVTGTLSLPAAGVIAVTGVISLAIGDIINIGGGEYNPDFTAENRTHAGATTVPGGTVPSPGGVEGAVQGHNEAVPIWEREGYSSREAYLQDTQPWRNGITGNQTNTTATGGESNNSSSGDGRSGTTSSRTNQARASNVTNTLNYNPTFNVDFRDLKRKMEKGLSEFERRISDLEDSVDSISDGRR